MLPATWQDTRLNCPLRELWEEWMQTGEHFTKTGRIRRATYADVCQWEATAWKQVPTKNVTSGFNKAESRKDSPDADINIDEDEQMDKSDY